MSMRHLEIDNKDKLPPAAPHADSAPWQVQRRWLPDWRSLAVLCAFTLLLLLIGYWLFGRDVRFWIQFGGGSAWLQAALWIAFGYVLLRSIISAAMRGLIIEQRGYKVPVWQAHAALKTLAPIDYAYADRKFPNAAAVTITEAPPLSMLESGDDTIEGEIVPVGAMLIPDSDWLSWIDRTPHLLLAGRTDAGKTTFAEAILSERIQNGDQIVICDPHYQPGKWHGIEATSDIEAILVLLAHVEQDMADRFTAFTAGKPTEDFQRLTILIDEVPAVVEETFRLTSSGTKKIVDDRWSRFARRLGSQARKVRISVILLSQTIFVEDLMINSAYRENFVRVGLGDKARPLLAEEKRNETKQQLYELLRGQSYPAAFEHNGEIHLLDTARVPALASRRNGHMAQLWTMPVPQPIKQTGSAAAQASSAVATSVAVPGTIVYPPQIKSKNAKIAWLLRQEYKYRQIEAELNVSHQTISQIKKALTYYIDEFM